MPRPRPNSRVRGLPCLAPLATTGPIDGAALWRAIEMTFEFRRTHPVPIPVPPPPEFWKGPYSAMAASDDLAWKTLEALSEAVSAFLNPALASPDCGMWKPVDWQWRQGQ